MTAEGGELQSCLVIQVVAGLACGGSSEFLGFFAFLDSRLYKVKDQGLNHSVLVIPSHIICFKL